jgi:hypothetical protein
VLEVQPAPAGMGDLVLGDQVKLDGNGSWDVWCAKT